MGRREESDKISGGRYVNPSITLDPGRDMPFHVGEGRLVNPITLEPGEDMPFHVGHSIGGISTVTPGYSFIRNIKFYCPAGGSVVTSIPEGEEFDFTIDYSCKNTTGFGWTMTIVWWDDTWAIKGYYTLSSTLDSKEIYDNLARVMGQHSYKYTMPNHSIKLHFNMFVSDDATPSINPPPQSEWSSVRSY